MIAMDFSSFQTTVGTAQKLRSVVSYVSELMFDIREFTDATVTTPEPGDALRHVRRIVDVFYGATTLGF